ncbi:MAG: hypothetical protein ACTSUE_18610 [Promethearchaeota archaeon]
MDFFENGNQSGKKDSGGIDLERFCVIFLAYFDEARGHQLLLVHPPYLKDDEEFMKTEAKTIFIHSIWWMSVELQAELSHVDLEFNGRNYLAKKFHAPSNRVKKRSGMNETTPETIVLILSIPINLNPFGGEILDNLYNKLLSDFKKDFSIAIEKSICEVKIIKSPRDREACLKGKEVLDAMRKSIREVLSEFAKKVQVNVNTEGEKQKALSYLLYQDIKKKPILKPVKDIFFEPSKKVEFKGLGDTLKQKIRLADSYMIKDEGKINLTLVNSSGEDLDDCVVNIAYLEDFFEKYFYSIDIEYWFDDEELNFQFNSVGNKIREEYLLNVKQGGETIYQEKILTTKLRVI